MINPPMWTFPSIFATMNNANNFVSINLTDNNCTQEIVGTNNHNNNSTIPFLSLYEMQQKIYQKFDTLTNSEKNVEFTTDTLVRIRIEQSKCVYFKCTNWRCYGKNSYMEQSQLQSNVYICYKCEQTQVIEENNKNESSFNLKQKIEFYLTLYDSTFKISTFTPEWQLRQWIGDLEGVSNLSEKPDKSNEGCKSYKSLPLVLNLVNYCSLERFCVRLKVCLRETEDLNNKGKHYVHTYFYIQSMFPFSKMTLSDQQKIMNNIVAY